MRLEIIIRVDEAADIIGLGDLMDRTPAEPSGGQRQGVAKGCAIVPQPHAFLFDEPLSNLDTKLHVQNGQEVVFEIRRDDLTPIGQGIAEGGDSAKMMLEIILSEPWRTETILYTSIAGQEALGKMFGPREVIKGERKQIDVAMDKTLIFDEAAGRSVRLD